MSIKFNEVTWYSKLGAIILFILVVPCLTFYIGRQYEATVIVTEGLHTPSDSSLTPHAKQTSVSMTPVGDPLNATYTIDGEQITLVNGLSSQSVAGSAGSLETRAFGKPVYGDLNGDGKQDAILFLYQETSGTGIFFYVAAAVNQNGSYKTTNTIFLGDRVSPMNINIKDGEAAVNYVVRRDNAPMTEAPSVGVSKYMKIKNGELVENISAK